MRGKKMSRRMNGTARTGSRGNVRIHTIESYNYDSTARVLAPEREEARRERRLEARRHNRAVRRRQEQALHMDFFYLVMLTLATVAALFICCSYIRVKSSISSSMRSIEKYEQQLEALKSENDALQTAIHTDIDLDHIYNVATTQLGMVYADRNQVIRYKKTESEYVRQYEDIPGETAKKK